HDPRVAVAEPALVDEPEPEAEREQQADHDQDHRIADEPVQKRDLARPSLFPDRGRVEDPGSGDPADQEERAGDVQEEKPVEEAHGVGTIIDTMDAPARHLRLLTETIAAVNST